MFPTVLVKNRKSHNYNLSYELLHNLNETEKGNHIAFLFERAETIHIRFVCKINFTENKFHFPQQAAKLRSSVYITEWLLFRHVFVL